MKSSCPRRGTGMMKEFIEVISTEGSPRVTLQDGIDVLNTALAVKKSIQTGQKIAL